MKSVSEGRGNLGLNNSFDLIPSVNSSIYQEEQFSNVDQIRNTSGFIVSGPSQNNNNNNSNYYNFLKTPKNA